MDVDVVGHSLLGWHRGVVLASSSARVQQWLDERSNAVMDSFAQIPGGKNVMQHMITRGWLSLGPQILAVKTEPIRPSTLVEYEVITLRERESKKDHTLKVAIGLLDRSLCVRAVLLQTPDMVMAQGMGEKVSYAASLPLVTHPTCFSLGPKFTVTLNGLSHHLEHHVLEHTRKWCSENVGWAPPTEMRGNDVLGGKTLLITINDGYPKFDEHKRPIPPARTIFRGTRVRGLLFIPHATVTCTHFGFGYFSVRFRRLIKQLMVLPRKKKRCQFVDQ